MPVKVRCPSCDKVLSAPDTARGKAVKCPGCETKVKVPAAADGAGGGKRVAAKAGAKTRDDGGSSGEFLANLDLSKAIDSSVSICPRCGTTIPEEASECPKCGVDPTTGQLSEAAKRRSGRKGPDPALYYSNAFKDAWRFTMANMRVVWRTLLYFLLSYGAAGGCLFMVFWCQPGTPPQAFWFLMFLVALLIFPGWLWFLRVETIGVSIRKKTDITDLNFDVFQCIALGLKTIFWGILFGTGVFSVLMLPLAMVHMAMPVSTKAWKWFSMLPVFFRNFKPTLFYWVVAFVADLPWIILTAGTAALSIGTVMKLVTAINEKQKPDVMSWVLLGLVIVAAIVCAFCYSFSRIFTMRVNGQLAYYFKDNLDLVTFIEDKVYVRKEVKLDPFGNPIKTKQDKAKQAIFTVIVLLVVAGAGYFIFMQLFGKK